MLLIHQFIPGGTYGGQIKYDDNYVNCYEKEWHNSALLTMSSECVFVMVQRLCDACERS